MHRSTLLKFAAGAVCAAAILYLVYQLPPVHSRLSWRMQLLQAYAIGLIHRADVQPTPASALYPTETPPATTTPAPESTAQDQTTQIPPTATLPPTPTPTAIPGKMVLDPPEWEKQDINNCGPTTLSMYLRYYGWEGDQYTIADVVKPVPEDRNVNVEELDHFTRNHAGWLSTLYRVGGNLDWIRRLVAAGIPAMIEETFHMDKPYYNYDDLWAGHYLLITGYDDARRIFTTQDSFDGPNVPVTYDKLDQNWKSFNRVLIVVYLPEQEETVRSILGADWDEATNRENAIALAEAETQKDPQDAYAWFNLGTNLVYFERYSEAVRAYDQARTIGLPQRMLRYQFGPFIAYFNNNRTEDLKAIAEYALQRTPSSEEALLWMGWALYREGDLGKARESFRKALENHPNYSDAVYALDFVGW